MTCLLEASPERWVIEEVAIEAFATRVVLTPAIASIPVLSASSGRFAAPLDVPPADPEIVLVEAAPALAQDNDYPTLLLAASSASPAYRPHTVIINAGGQETHVATSPHKAVIGTSLDQLGGAQTSALRDDMNRVTVTMVDPTCVLLSCDDEALAAGANLALLGEEYFQFAEARPEAPGTWVLSGLLRGRMGSEEAIADHAAGEPFVLIDPRRMVAVRLPLSAANSTVDYRLMSGLKTSSRLVNAFNLRPPSPVGLSARVDGNGALTVSWVRRSRSGWAWIDEVDAPIGEGREAYRVELQGQLGTVLAELSAPLVTLSANELAPLGSGAAAISVQQIGNSAASRPATMFITIP